MVYGWRISSKDGKVTHKQVLFGKKTKNLQKPDKQVLFVVAFHPKINNSWGRKKLFVVTCFGFEDIRTLTNQSFALFHTICLHETSKYEIIFVFLLFLDKVINILDKNNYLSKSFSESIHLQYYDMYNKIRAKNIVRIKINMITFTN